MRPVLVIAPHPDDELLGCGGSIVNRVREGRSVHILFLSSGEQASPTIPSHILGPMREDEARAAATSLDISSDKLMFLRIPDGEINVHDLERLKEIITIIRSLQPDLVYIPHRDESSFDHRQAYDLAWRAITMAPSKNYPECGTTPCWIDTVLAYEVWTPIREFQYSEDISDAIDRKIQAIQCYQSQSFASKGQSTYIGEAARFLPGYRAAMSIGTYREVFQVLRLSNIPRS